MAKPNSNEQIVKLKPVTFDEALEATKFGKFNYFIIFLSGFMQVNLVLESLGISFILPVSECDLNLTVKEKGVLSSITFVGIISTSHLWGFLSDTTGRRHIIRPTLIIAFMFTVISSFSTNFILLVILRLLNGAFISASSSTVFAYLGEFNTNKNRNRAILGSSFICAFTSIFFPITAWLVINQDWSFYIPYLDIIYKPWRFYMIFNGIPGFFVSLCLFKIPESPKFMLSIGETDKTIKILKKIYAMNTGKTEEEYPVLQILPEENLNSDKSKQLSKNHKIYIFKILISMWQQTQPLFSIEHIRKTILICVLQFCSFISAHGMYIWFPYILNTVMKFTQDNPNDQNYTICEIIEKERNILHQNNTLDKICVEKLEISTYVHTIVLELLYVTFFLLMGSIMRILGRVRVLCFVLMGCGISGIVSALVTIPLLGIYLFVVQLLCVLSVSLVSAITVDLYPTNLRGMAICISLMFGRLGTVIGSNVSGILLTNNCQSAFFTSGSLLVFCGFLGFLLPKTKFITKTELNPSEKEIDCIS